MMIEKHLTAALARLVLLVGGPSFMAAHAQNNAKPQAKASVQSADRWEALSQGAPGGMLNVSLQDHQHPEYTVTIISPPSGAKGFMQATVINALQEPLMTYIFDGKGVTVQKAGQKAVPHPELVAGFQNLSEVMAKDNLGFADTVPRDVVDAAQAVIALPGATVPLLQQIPGGIKAELKEAQVAYLPADGLLISMRNVPKSFYCNGVTVVETDFDSVTKQQVAQSEHRELMGLIGPVYQAMQQSKAGEPTSPVVVEYIKQFADVAATTPQPQRAHPLTTRPAGPQI